MKNIIKVMLVILMIIPIMIHADTYEESLSKANDYLLSNDYKNTYKGYMLINVEKEFKYGGLISEKEFLTTLHTSDGKTNDIAYSYLYDGDKYWGINKYIIGIIRENESIASTRVTEYVMPEIKVSGLGTKKNPWIFARKNIITVTSNDITKGKVSLSECDSAKNYVSLQLSEDEKNAIKICPEVGYEYSYNDCEKVIDDSNIKNGILSIADLDQSMNCTVDFMAKNYSVTINVVGGTASTSKIKIPSNDKASLNVIPNEKYAFKNATCDNNQKISYKLNNNFEFSNITHDATCVINYELVENTYNYLTSDQIFVAPYDGYYLIDAYGAQGSENGGKGAKISANIHLLKGQKLIINTGGINGYNGGGLGLYSGGGATTVKIDNKIILAAAGGGGGNEGSDGGVSNGEGGLKTSSGSETNGGPGTPGTNGGGGGSGYNYEFKTNCSSCYTGSNTCTGGTVSYNCSSCHTGSNTCTGGTVTYNCSNCHTGSNTCVGGTVTYNCSNCHTGSNTCVGGYVNGSCKSHVCTSYSTINPTAPGCAGIPGCWGCSCTSYNRVWVSCKSGSNTCKYGCDSYYSSCATGSNTCKYGCDSYYSSCATGSNTCSYGCDSYYSSCATGSNTCEYGCDTEVEKYNSGQGGANIIDSSLNAIDIANGINESNGKLIISYYKEQM